MKHFIDFINESLYKLNDIKKTIDQELKKCDKKLIDQMSNEIKDDIDKQDEFIEGNEDSYIWKFITACAKELNTKPENLWEDCGGSYIFADAISKL